MHDLYQEDKAKQIIRSCSSYSSSSLCPGRHQSAKTGVMVGNVAALLLRKVTTSAQRASQMLDF